MLELRHLRVLRAVARTGSYSAAAVRLGYTQPAISQQMKALERLCGTPLVVRCGRKMRLTEAGTELVRRAGLVLAEVAAAERAVAELAGRRAGQVRLVVFPSGSATLVPPVAARIGREHPDIRLSLTEAEPPESVELLRAGECDLALAFTYPGEPEPAETPGLMTVRLFTDPLVALLPAGHRLCAAPEVALSDLSGEHWIAGCARCREHLVHACAAAGFRPDITFATDDNLAVQGLVAAGLGVAVVPELMLNAVRRPDVCVRPLRPALCREVFLCTWPDLARVPAIGLTVAALRRACARS
ncbi:LysR family transcriptional regulator [Crossiella sp. CA-258035]|uniref:LysR family transcriptional regulator n=1 Tax=Crossiella sp. CA-258035 TaxID=2981138 RepID=UPI0024BD4F65|nr:LysR family transcriptional regulator [Crossiella sp. CA-258035]WHT16880.1 LysR family transcriptional regulator [Crossiella sp. CA-258035]